MGVPGIRATKAQDVKTDHASDAVAIPPWSANADRQQLPTAHDDALRLATGRDQHENKAEFSEEVHCSLP